MDYFFESGGDNANIRRIFEVEKLKEKANKIALSFKKAEDKIHAKYDKMDKDLQQKEKDEIDALILVYQKRMKITMGEE